MQANQILKTLQYFQTNKWADIYNSQFQFINVGNHYVVPDWDGIWKQAPVVFPVKWREIVNVTPLVIEKTHPGTEEVFWKDKQSQLTGVFQLHVWNPVAFTFQSFIEELVAPKVHTAWRLHDGLCRATEEHVHFSAVTSSELTAGNDTQAFLTVTEEEAVNGKPNVTLYVGRLFVDLTM